MNHTRSNEPEDSPNGRVCVFLDSQGVCSELHPSTGRVFGQSAEAMKGKIFWEQFTAGLNQELRIKCHQVLETGESVLFTHSEPIQGLSWESDIHRSSHGLTLVIQDVTLTKRHQAVINGQQRILEMVARGDELTVILDALLELVEQQSPRMLCSILLLEPDGNHVRHASGPSLPEEYNLLINGLRIGPEAGSCGTALYLKKSVFVGDISTDPLWVNYRSLAESHGLRACWSTPIFDAADKVLGSFAIYHREVGLPTTRHRELIQLATHLASICIVQHNAAEALRTSEARYARAVQGTSDGIWDWNIVTNEDYLSPRWKALLGFTDSELPDHADSFYKRLHPEDAPVVTAALKAHFEGNAPFDENIRLQMKDGSYRWFHTRGQVERDIHGNPVRMAGALSDINTRKETEMALESERIQANTVLNSLSSHIAVVDGAGVIIAVNESWLNFARENGAANSPQVRPGVNYLDIITPSPHETDDSVQMAFAGISAVLEGKQTRFEMEYSCNSPDEDRRFVMRVNALKNGVGAVLAHENITERTLAQVALQESAEFNRQIIASANEGIVVLDADLRYTVWNEFMVNLLGIPVESVLGRHPVELFPWVEAGGQLDAMQRVLKGEIITLPDSQRLKTRSKRISWLHSRLAPLRDRHGEIIGVIATISDITKRKHAEQQLLNSHTQLRALAARLQSVREEQNTHIAREIHDVFGQQLTALKLDLIWLKRRIDSADDTDFKSPLIEKVDASVELVDSTIRSVQKVATELRPGLLNKLGLAAAIEHEVRAFEQRSGLQCHLELAPLPDVISSKQAIDIFRICQELLTNVVRHAHAKNVMVTLGRKGRNVHLEVQDDGCGISRKQLAATNSLGLLGMKERAQLHGGSLVFRGTAGSGTIAKLVVPLPAPS